MDVIKFITDSQIYQHVIIQQVTHARKFLWLATSDIKDLYIDKNTKMVPFLELLSDLVKKRIEIRLLHAKEPGPAFREDFDKYPNLINGLSIAI